MTRTLLAPLRLSRLKDSSTNPAGQRARITDYGEDHDDTMIFVDVDMDVSGAAPIRERPGLGPWLAPDKITAIDGFVADEMDRLSRDMLDYLQFARDMAALGKIIIDVSDGTDTSTERGRQALEDRILAAQREREKIATRRRKAAQRLGDEGRYGGGPPGYGYSPRCLCHGERRCPDPEHTIGWWRVQDPEEAPVAKWMISQRIAGRGFSAIAADLNGQQIPSPRGGIWRGTTVRKILTSPNLLGHEVEMQGGSGVKGTPSYKKGQVVGTRRGKDGQPVIFTDEPLIADEVVWDQLTEAIRAGSRARGQAQSRHLLYRVLYCRHCSPRPFSPETGVRMYGNRRHPGEGQRDHREYYNCKQCGLNIRLDRVEPLVEGLVLAEAGDRVLLERRVRPGDDHAAGISRLERAAERRRELLADDPGDEDMRASLDRTEAQIAELRAAPHEPPTVEWREVPNRIKVRDHWDALDVAGRAQFLRDWEVTAFADRQGVEVRLGWLPAHNEFFRLSQGDSRLVPTALPALISHSQEWQRVPGAVLPARVAQPSS
jgi:DNA invertase Pin-like site-specific DNA recombinase